MAERVIPYGQHCVEDDDIAAVVEVLRSDFLTTGPMVERFETALAARTGAKHAIVCSSGTAALHLAAMALDLGPGDAAVVPSLTFLATANAVRLTGAEVIFADVDQETGLMNPEDMNQALNRGRKSGLNVRAVLPVHINGQCVDVDTLSTIAKHEGVALIADASHAIGAEQLEEGSWRPVGSGQQVLMTTFSFHPVKTIAMGEGGAITTDDSVLAERLSRLRNHGIIRDKSQFTERELAQDSDGLFHPWYYEMHEIGLNYRASDIHCALGLSQLGKLDRLVRARGSLVARYDELLAPYAAIVQPIRRVSHCKPAWHLYPVRIKFGDIQPSKRHVVDALRTQGIGSQVHYIPVHQQPYYRIRYGAQDLDGAGAYYESILSLPLYPGLTEADQKKICSALGSALQI